MWKSCIPSNFWLHNRWDILAQKSPDTVWKWWTLYYNDKCKAHWPMKGQSFHGCKCQMLPTIYGFHIEKRPGPICDLQDKADMKWPLQKENGSVTLIGWSQRPGMCPRSDFRLSYKWPSVGKSIRPLFVHRGPVYCTMSKHSSDWTNTAQLLHSQRRFLS